MTAWFFVFLFLVVLISGGILISTGDSPRPRPLGWIFFVLGVGTATFTVDRWAKVLPGIFAIATLNGLIILISGHALNQPATQVPRLLGGLFTVLMACACFITASFADRHLTTPDRAAYLGILACFVAMLASVMTAVGRWELPVCIGFIASLAVLSARRFLAVDDRGVPGVT